MSRRPEVLDPANTCSHCPHALVRLSSGTMWCACEDCHAGGLIQGREPKDNHTVAVRPSFGPVIAVDKPTSETNDDLTDGEVWIDPVHRVG